MNMQEIQNLTEADLLKLPVVGQKQPDAPVVYVLNVEGELDYTTTHTDFDAAKAAAIELLVEFQYEDREDQIDVEIIRAEENYVQAYQLIDTLSSGIGMEPQWLQAHEDPQNAQIRGFVEEQLDNGSTENPVFIAYFHYLLEAAYGIPNKHPSQFIRDTQTADGLPMTYDAFATQYTHYFLNDTFGIYVDVDQLVKAHQPEI